MIDPIFIERDGHRTWFKWHRARRSAADPEFSGRRILEAMRLGASVEVDLVIHADHGCAILHDKVLERATTGRGRVIDTPAAALRQLKLRGNDGAPLDEPVMLLEDLCALLASARVHPQALLQLDFKERRAALDAATIAAVADHVAPFARNMILSGGDAEAVAALAERTPGLATGYDPTPEDLDAADSPQTHAAFAAFTAAALDKAPDAAFIYLDYRLILKADRVGFDMIAAVHAAGRRVDAWTIQAVTEETLAAVRRLLDLRVDQITTDDSDTLAARLAA
ncbi:glycerophosphodiester phosphodiesterase [Jiella sp. MQZ9-1]|uniref:Glycerophosphodiester phosphodiesterase n=1 Tax=Jiella flava TaxID=2816857 RepID=A0A939JWP0_9HYPH|nr:glycerophosphodiester phosphodiesterase family protein [Jiella flava]MBO0662511.1 glycerophosphodiester phosphodiesterase [Jiella flava]MCD2471736.1 glycerophosphodiester phosphodiesterase [Jiella flava]